ncbi:MAG: hypothetical protein B6I28_02490 [Fusobacteriia bacterium 4572_132]|nr:MAG: hypothetical protein B6I28_02490 [Fusobacteriia bacterium 4572_132]
MKKIGMIGSILSLLLVVGVATYINYCNTDASMFIVKGTDIISYNERDEKLVKEFKEIQEKIEKINMKDKSGGSTKLYEEMNKLDKYVEKTLIIHTEQEFKNIKKIEDVNLIFGISLGKYYSIALMNLKGYFDKTKSGNYKLKEKYKEEFKKIVMSNNNNKDILKIIEKTEVFMIPFKSYFIFSFSEDYLENYLAKVKEGNKNENLLTEYYKIKKESDGFIISDLAKFENLFNKYYNGYIEKLNFFELIIGYDYKEEEIKIKFNIKGKGKGFDLLDSSKIEERKLVKYIDKNRVYFSNNSFKNIAISVLDELKEKQGADYNMLAKMFFGYGIDEIVDSVGNEVVIELGKDVSGVLNLKNKEMLKKIFESMKIREKEGKYQIKENYSLTLEDNEVILNSKLKKTNKEIKIPQNTCLYLDINLEELTGMKEFKGIGFKVIGNSQNDKIELEMKIKKEAIIKLLDNEELINKIQ